MISYILENSFYKVTLLNLGATIYSWEVKGKGNRNIVLSNQNVKDYSNPKNGYFGATIGRVANRIKDGKFTINNVNYQLKTNFDNGANAGHGGDTGFWAQGFEATVLGNQKVIFSYTSPDKHEGYPGTLTVNVTYELSKTGLMVEYDAKSDKDTIVNLTNHSYFNLDASETILNHHLYLDAPTLMEYDDKKSVTGVLKDIKDTALDFRSNPTLEGAVLSDYAQAKVTQGLDHCFFFGDEKKLVLSGQDLKLTISTSYPCVQLYSTNYFQGQKLLGNKPIKQYHALAIEPQLPVDAINHPSLPSIILKKGERYHHFIKYTLEEFNGQ